MLERSSALEKDGIRDLLPIIFSFLDIETLKKLICVNKYLSNFITSKFDKNIEFDGDILISFKLDCTSKDLYDLRFFMTVGRKHAPSSEIVSDKSYFITDNIHPLKPIVEFSNVTNELVDGIFNYEKLELCQSFAIFNKSDFPLYLDVSRNFQDGYITKHDFLTANNLHNIFKHFENTRKICYEHVYTKFNPFKEIQKITMTLEDKLNI